MKITSRKLAFAGILSALSLITFTVENLFPPLILPGAKMGLSNIFILIALFTLGWGYALAVLSIKTVLGSLFSGNISAVLYSLPAGLTALIVEMIIYYFIRKTSITAISVCGAVINTTIQNLMFCLITNTPEYLCYLPYLALIGILSGLVVGVTVFLILKYIPLNVFYGKDSVKDEGEED